MYIKLKKIIKFTSAGLFLIALVINVKVTLDDPFVMLSKMVIAQETQTGSDTNSDSDTKYGGLLPCVEKNGDTQTSSYGFKSVTGTTCRDGYGIICGEAFTCEEDTNLPELPINQTAYCAPTKCIF